MRPSAACWERVFWLGAAALTVLALLLLSLATFPAPAPVAAQARPTLTPTSAPSSATAEPAGEPAALSGCESICGQAINLQSGVGEPGQTVRFAGNGWSVETTADAGGGYAFGRLGTEAGLLNLVVPEGSDLHPVTRDLAVAPRLGWVIIVNLGAYRQVWAAPPLAPAVWAEPAWAPPGGQVAFTARVENRLPTEISGVLVTDLLPEELVLVGVTTDRGEANRAGNYGVAFVGDLAPGARATVRFIADVPEEAAAGSIRSTVSLIYRENAAAQASTAVYVGWASPTPTSVAAMRTPTPGATGIPQTLPSTGPSLLPMTGYGYALTGIAGGLALATAALAARRVRRARKRDGMSSREQAP
jgi:uncharacterized repeat protein (TIGR01451 family)